MRFPTARSAIAVLIGAITLSCTDALTAVKRPITANREATDAPAIQKPLLVISQIYGGGGNSGATYTNDFIELHNPGGAPVSVKGWSVQYASASGTSWQATALSDTTIPPGGFYLVQESKGSGGTVALPKPDASASVAMSANNGKVALVASTVALTGACPTGGTIIDLVSFGTGNCGKAADALTNSTAALRNDDGCAYTGDPSADFGAGAPTPRNSARANVSVCAGALPPGPLDHFAITSSTSTVFVGGTLPLVAIPRDSNNQAVPGATVTWSSDNMNVASVDENGVVTGVAENAAPVPIRATAVDAVDGITKTASMAVTVTLPVIKFIDFSSSGTNFPPGFQTQIFATARTGSGGPVIDANFTFESVDPQIATVYTYENTGIITGVGAGAPRIKITATPKVGGAAYSYMTSAIVTIESPVTSPTSIYAKNDEFGDPTPASADKPNDLLISRPQYTISYNESRGTPNWVAYELDARQIVPGQDRCNCFAADTVLPLDKQIVTADYTNGGYDRGHMTRSADRTTANADNAATYYLTNVVPQIGDLNQGVWAQFENALGDSATKGGRAVYIITGPLYSQGKTLTFLKNEGKVAIPDSTWKIALIGPANGGNPFTRANVQSWSDLGNVTILAVNMPNVLGVRNDPWSKYLTTVQKIEQSTGYDFLSLLQASLQRALEANDHAPVANFSVGTANEGSPVTFDASTSSDADIGRTDLGRTEAMTYQWSFSDGFTATGPTVTRTFPKYTSVVATLTVSDAFGWPSTISQTVKINDVAPIVASLPSALLITGETYSATGTFIDPGLDTWTASFDFNDGTASNTVTLSGKSFSFPHVYHTAGQFNPEVTVTDDGGLIGSATATVTVQTPLAATQRLASNVQSFANASAIVGQEAQPLLASLDAAQKQIMRGNDLPAVNELGAFINKVNAAAMTGRMTTDAAAQLSALAVRIQRALTLD